MNKRYLGFLEIYSLFSSLWKDETEDLEREFTEYVGCKYALGTSYARTAIYLGLKIINSCQKEVMVPALTCSAVRDAILLAGAKPVFIDIDIANLNMVLSDAEKKLTSKTIAIILTHYYGGVASNTDKVLEFAKRNDLIIIEDCAHSLGAEFKGKKVGNFGDISVFSLTKNMLNFGGGVFCTNNEILYNHAKVILSKSVSKGLLQKLKNINAVAVYGYKTTVDKIVFDRIGNSIFKWWLINVPDIFFSPIRKVLKSLLNNENNHKNGFYNVCKDSLYEQDEVCSINLNMYPIIASVGRIQLKKIDEINAKRIQIAQKIAGKMHIYFKSFSDSDAENKNVYTNFPFWFEKNDLNEIVKKCKAEGVLLRKSWPAFQEWWEDQDTQNVRIICDHLLLLIVNPMLNDREIGKLIETVIGVSNECCSARYNNS